MWADFFNTSAARKMIRLLSRFQLVSRVADALIIAFTLYLTESLFGLEWESLQIATWVLGVTIYIVMAELTGLYRSFREESLSLRIGRIGSIWAITAAVLLLTAFLTKSSDSFSRSSTLLWFILAPLSLSVWHVLVGTLLMTARAQGYNLRRAAIVGITEISGHLARNIQQKPWMGFKIIGYFEDRRLDRTSTVDEINGPCLGTYADLTRMARNGEIDTVFISLPMRAEIRINQLISNLGCATTSIYLAYDFASFNLLPSNYASRWSNIGGVSVLGVVESPFRGLWGAVKQAEDIVLGSMMLAVAAVPMMIIAFVVKITSKGPIFYRQTRYGLNGKRIDVLKFRTMKVCESDEEFRQAVKNDNRLTKIGAFLRRSSLDELPQLLHVITGKMSIVGPRPHAVAHNEQYREIIDHYMVRHKVKPGLTGWAQVNGWRGETDTDEKMKKRVEYDLVYIRNWTVFFDLKIILMTIFGSKTHRNAY